MVQYVIWVFLALIPVSLVSPLKDPCEDILPVCANGTCVCSDTRCFVRGIHNDTCAQCCRGHFFDDGMCSKCKVCDDPAETKNSECAKDGSDRQCAGFTDWSPVEKCVDDIPKDVCTNKPMCDDHGNCYCNDTSRWGCNFVRGTGETKSCTQCCTGYFYDDGRCEPCGKCQVSYPIRKRECQLDGNDDQCRSGLPAIKPSECPPPPSPSPPKDSKVGVIIGVCVGVIGGVICLAALIGCLCCCYKSKSKNEYQRGIENVVIDPPTVENDRNGMTDLRAYSIAELNDPYHDENAPGYDSENHAKT